MSDDKTCIVVDEAVKEATLEDFIAKLPENKPRFAVFDFEYEAEGATRNKILFINWAPDAASVRDKMVHASSKDSFRKKLQGVAVEIQVCMKHRTALNANIVEWLTFLCSQLQATDLSEIDRTTVLDKVKAP